MGAPKKGAWREARRRQAWELKQQGWKQKDIGQGLGVSEGAVSQWFGRVRPEGIDGLSGHARPGGPSRLTAAEKAQIPLLLAPGAEGHGFRGEVWIRGRIRDLIARQFGVRYHLDHGRKLLRTKGLSYQQPVERARQGDEAQIAAWAQTRWPEVTLRAESFHMKKSSGKSDAFCKTPIRLLLLR